MVIFVQAPVLISEESVKYVLPYAPGASYRVLQGYNGPWGHDSHSAFAYDFQMPIGTQVHAARSGKVVRVEESHMDSTRKPGDENVVVIRHDDGTYGRYYHLTRNGAEVAVGDDVKQGQLIGFSGDSGASAGPHLHFDVTESCFEWGCQTIKIDFLNTRENPLKQGDSY